MEDQKFDGGPAFPSIEKLRKLHFGETPTSYEVDGSDGISMRDYFAAHAPITLDDAIKACKAAGAYNPTGGEILDMVSQMRFGYADAMLKARNA